MKTKINHFHSKIFNFFILTLFLSLFANNCFSQWKTSISNAINNDIIISYEVIYDKELTVEEKKSPEYLSEIIIAFNKDKILERKVGSNSIPSNNYTLYDYNALNIYMCSVQSNFKKAIKIDFHEPTVAAESIQNSEPKMIFNFPCEKALVIMNNKPKEILYTKNLGLRFCRQFKIDGFVFEYPGYSKTLGNYTVKVKKIDYTKLNDSFYSLDDFKIQTEEELKKQQLESTEKMNATRMKSIGKKAASIYEFSIKNEKINTKKFAADVIVYNFWFTTCAPCKKEIPKLNELKEKYKDKNVHFIAIALDPKYKITAFLKSTPLNYDIIPDGRPIAQDFEVVAYPTNIIVDKKGIIQLYETGYKSDIMERMTHVIEESLNQ